MSQTTSRDDYEEVEVLRDDSGVIAVVNRNKHTGFYSFAFFKEFKRDGQWRRSAFFSRRHALPLQRLLKRVTQYLDPRIDKEMARRA